MKRDPDLEREILLAIKDYDGEAAPGYADFSGLEARGLQVNYQVVLRHEAGPIYRRRKLWNTGEEDEIARRLDSIG